MRIVYLLLVVFLILSIAGCQQEANRTTRQPAVTPATPGGAGTTVNVELGEWYVKLTPASVPQGNVTFQTKNVGEHLHALRIEGNGVDQSGKNLKAGESETMTMNLSAGTYEADCPIGNHEERGMKTNFTVTAP